MRHGENGILATGLWISAEMEHAQSGLGAYVRGNNDVLLDYAAVWITTLILLLYCFLCVQYDR